MKIKNLIVLLAACGLVFALEPAGSTVRNVILCIGDGMGLAQVSAARIRVLGALGRLTMESMPITAVVTTCSADKLITDSGAAATALATGYKTRNGMIAVAPDNTKLRTILEACQAKGLSAGLVATSSITHATPAAFGSHSSSRGDEAGIAGQLLGNRIDDLLAGGRMFFLPDTITGSSRSDHRNLIDEATAAGYQYLSNRRELDQATAGRFLGLFQTGELTGDSLEPTLAEMTAAAIRTLRQDKDGFFLMVEGSQIDWGGHSNDIDAVIQEVVQFDAAVKACLEFASDDGHTLVVVTADHETGGLSIIAGFLNGDSLRVGWQSTDHTATQVPLYAYGPQAVRFTGALDNTDIPKKIALILGIPGF